MVKKFFSITILILFVLNYTVPLISNAVEIEDGSHDAVSIQEEIGKAYEIKEEETWDASENPNGGVTAKWTLKDKTLTKSNN